MPSCARWCFCSIDDPDDVLRQLHSLLHPGGELRFLEHVGSAGLRGRLQMFADATCGHA